MHDKTISRSGANDYRKNPHNGFENQHNHLRKINNCKPLPRGVGPLDQLFLPTAKWVPD